MVSKIVLFTWRKGVDVIIAEDKRTQEIKFLKQTARQRGDIISCNVQ